MAYIVARHSPQLGFFEPVRPMFSAHGCTLGRKLGLKERYQSREEAERDAQRLERLAKGSAYLYNATRITESEEEERASRLDAMAREAERIRESKGRRFDAPR